MARVGGEAVARRQAVDHRRKQFVGKLEGAAALAADGVMVGGMGVQGELHRAGAHVRFDDQVQFAQQIQRAIDCRQIDVAVDALHRSEDILGRNVAGHLLNRLQDDRPLRRHPHPAPFQFLDKVSGCHFVIRISFQNGDFGFAIANELQNLR